MYMNSTGRETDVRKVLVVDDDPRNLFALTAALEQEHYEVIGAQSGEEALTTLNANPQIECVLTDIMMPEMDGYELTRRIRARGASMRLPVIAVTAKASPEDEQKCWEAGCASYVTKPINTRELLRKLRSVIEP